MGEYSDYLMKFELIRFIKNVATRGLSFCCYAYDKNFRCYTKWRGWRYLNEGEYQSSHPTGEAKNAGKRGRKRRPGESRGEEGIIVIFGQNIHKI